MKMPPCISGNIHSVSGLVLQSIIFRLPRQKIGLGRWKETHKNNDQPVHPFPTGSLDEIATSNGTDAGSDERSESPYRHGSSSLLDRHHVGDAAASDGDGNRTGHTHQEPESQHHVHVLRQGGGHGEDYEEDVAPAVEGCPTVRLTQRGDEKRPNGEAENVHRDHKRRDGCRCLPELDHDARNTWGKHGGTLESTS